METIVERGNWLGGGTHMSSAASSRRALWAGRILSGVAILFLVLDAAMKVLRLAPAVDGTIQLGYPASIVFGLGIVQLACLAFYLIPRTSVLGSILLTGYLGGAVATHARLDHPLFTHILFPVYVAILVWGGLCLRDRRLGDLLPLRARD